MKTTMKRHTHRTHTTRTAPFFGPVSARQNPVAHGNVCIVDRCRCGAERGTNRNAGQSERGAWSDPRDHSVRTAGPE